MKKTIRRILALILASCILAATCTQAAAATRDDVHSALSQSAQYMQKAVPAPQVGSVGGEWAVIGLARSGLDLPASYRADYYAAATAYVKDCKGILHDRMYTEYSRLILALTAIGADPSDVAGYNLILPLGDFDATVWQGLNGPIWALLALDCGGYDVPHNAGAATQATRQMYIDEILAREHTTGGWSLRGTGDPDPDMTGMALQALASYREQDAVQAAIDRALVWLSGAQDAQGGFSAVGTSHMESVAQVLIALCALEVPLDDERFVKNGRSVLDSLLSLRRPDGSFRQAADATAASQMASEQGLCALAAALRAADGRSALYRMDDVSPLTAPASGGDAPGGRHSDVRALPVTAPGATFDDIAGHRHQAAIEALRAREIIGGMDAHTFAPDATMTRAQFAAIAVRALGLEPKVSGTFSDVPAGQWYAPYVDTAHAYGILSGVGGGRFNPEGVISRQEAAVMVANAALLCGLDTALREDEVRNTLAQFDDYTAAAQWARPALAYCYRAGILDQSALSTEPTRSILRSEVAQMLYHLLDAAQLL